MRLSTLQLSLLLAASVFTLWVCLCSQKPIVIGGAVESVYIGRCSLFMFLVPYNETKKRTSWFWDTWNDHHLLLYQQNKYSVWKTLTWAKGAPARVSTGTRKSYLLLTSLYWIPLDFKSIFLHIKPLMTMTCFPSILSRNDKQRLKLLRSCGTSWLFRVGSQTQSLILRLASKPFIDL